MMASYRRITSAELEKLRNDAQAADAYFGLDYDEEDDEAADAWDSARRGEGRYLSIGKAWHGVHFLLTGNSSYDTEDIPLPLRNVVLGGEPTEWDASYGAVRVLTPQAVRGVAEALQHISRQDLTPRLDVAAFNTNSIYPGSSHVAWGSEDIDWLLDSYEKVANFFHVAAAEGDAMLLSLD